MHLNSRLAPIALFVYKRPAHVEAVLRNLRANPEFLDSPLYVFADGPRRAEDEPAVAQVRTLVREVAHPRIVIVEAPRNQGLANSVIQGVSRLCAEYGRAIVVEDDLELSPGFLSFMNDALERYATSDRVMHVSGFTYPTSRSPSHPFFYRNASSWGWAIWRRSWDFFEPDAAKLLAAIEGDRKKKFQFDINGTADYSKMLRLQAERKIDSWSIRWDASMFLREGLSLYPPRSLVRNRGMDGSGTHCGTNSFYEVELAERCFAPFPDEIVENPAFVRGMTEFHRKMRGSVWARAWRRLRRIIRENGRA